MWERGCPLVGWSRGWSEFKCLGKAPSPRLWKMSTDVHGNLSIALICRKSERMWAHGGESLALIDADLGVSVPSGELLTGWASVGQGMCQGQKLPRTGSPIFPAEQTEVPWQRKHCPEQWGTKIFEEEMLPMHLPTAAQLGEGTHSDQN